MNIVERAHAFVALMAIAGVTAVVSAADESESDRDGGADPSYVKPALSVDEVASRFHVAAGMHNATNFIVAALFDFADILVFLAILAFTWAIVYVLPSMVDDMLRRFEAPRHVRALAKTSLQILIGIAGLWLALSAIGINFLGIVLSFGVVSIVLSNGVGTAISNAVAGIVNTTDDLQPGSRVSVYGVTGVVEEAGFFAVRVRVDSGDMAGDSFVVPNNSFLQAPWYVCAPRREPDAELDELEGKNLDFLRSKGKMK